MEIDFTTGNEERVLVTMTRTQLAALANTIAWNVDMDTVEIDNGEPERAAFLATFRDRARAALA